MRLNRFAKLNNSIMLSITESDQPCFANLLRFSINQVLSLMKQISAWLDVESKKTSYT